jgi:hypothetical protein
MSGWSIVAAKMSKGAEVYSQDQSFSRLEPVTSYFCLIAPSQDSLTRERAEQVASNVVVMQTNGEDLSILGCLALYRITLFVPPSLPRLRCGIAVPLAGVAKASITAIRNLE